LMEDLATVLILNIVGVSLSVLLDPTIKIIVGSEDCESDTGEGGYNKKRGAHSESKIWDTPVSM